MSYLVFKDGLPLFNDTGQLQFSATSPPDEDCCCGPAPLTCCPEAEGQSVWCDVSDTCLATGPIEFVYKGSVSRPDGTGFANLVAKEWEGVFCAEGDGRGYLRCGSGYLGQSTVIWRLRLERFDPGQGLFMNSIGILPTEGQCSPFALEFTANLFMNNDSQFCEGCSYGPCTFTFTL